MQYPEPVWAHFRNPRNAGVAIRANAHGDADTPAARARLRISLRQAGEVVEAAAFQARGCPCVIAAGSWLAEWATGRKLTELKALQASQIEQALDLPPTKRHCAVMASEALKRALENKDSV